MHDDACWSNRNASPHFARPSRASPMDKVTHKISIHPVSKCDAIQDWYMLYTISYEILFVQFLCKLLSKLLNFHDFASLIYQGESRKLRFETWRRETLSVRSGEKLKRALTVTGPDLNTPMPSLANQPRRMKRTRRKHVECAEFCRRVLSEWHMPPAQD